LLPLVEFRGGFPLVVRVGVVARHVEYGGETGQEQARRCARHPETARPVLLLRQFHPEVVEQAAVIQRARRSFDGVRAWRPASWMLCFALASGYHALDGTRCRRLRPPTRFANSAFSARAVEVLGLPQIVSASRMRQGS